MLVAVEEQQVIAFNKNEDKVFFFILEQQALHNKTRKNALMLISCHM